MPATRYVRDEIILQGLDLAACPTVSQHDAPGGIVDPNAYSIKWLQNALDMFHKKYPFASDIVDVPVTLPANQDAIYVTSLGPTGFLPTDFILDVRNGVFVDIANQTAARRLYRKSFQFWLQISQQYKSTPQTAPVWYCVVQNQIRIAPRIQTPLSGTLYYYKLATALDPNSVVNFPDEWTLIEFISLKALEWVRAIDRGTAQNYLTKALAGLRSSGLLHEPEYEDGIPIENNQSIRDELVLNRNAWMGNYAI